MNTKQTVYNILASIKSEPVNVELGIFDKQTQADLDKAFAAADVAYDQVQKAKANFQKSIAAHKSQLSSYDKWISGLQKKADSITPTGNNKIDAENKKAAERTVADAKKQKQKIEDQMKLVERLLNQVSAVKFI
jgi:cytochrome c peroxidase